MALNELIDKYKADNNELRLTIMLETYGKKATAKNIKALKLLILDNDIQTLKMFLGDSDAMKQQDDLDIQRQLEEEAKRPPNQDDFELFCKKQLGDPKDSNSLGNQILAGRTFNWYLKSNIKPDVIMQKYSQMAGKDPVEIDFHPSFKTNPPTWECCILGTKTLNRNPVTRVGD